MKNIATLNQNDPITNEGTRIVDLVVSDLHERAELGKKRYGTYLRAGNGREALIDAYQESLDLAMYLRQALEESGETPLHDLDDDYEIFLLWLKIKHPDVILLKWQAEYALAYVTRDHEKMMAMSIPRMSGRSFLANLLTEFDTWLHEDD